MGYRFWGLSICHLLYRFVASRVKSATWLRPFWSYNPMNIAHSLQLQSDQDCAQFSVTIRLRLCTVCTSNLIKIAHSWHLQSDQDCTVCCYNPIKIAHSLQLQSNQDCAQFAVTIRSRLPIHQGNRLTKLTVDDPSKFLKTFLSRSKSS